MLLKLKPHHRPLYRYRPFSIAAASLLFISFLLLLLVSLSLPLIKDIYLLKLTSTTTRHPVTSIATELRFGVWGICAISQYNDPHFIPRCTAPQIGYDVPDSIISVAGVPPTLVKALLKVILVLLILHPVIAALCFFALFFSLFLALHSITIIALIATLISALLSSIVLAADIALVVEVRQNIGLLPDYHFAVDFGNAVWMALTALICTWAALVLLSIRACYCCGVNPPQDLEDSKDEDVRDEDVRDEDVKESVDVPDNEVQAATP